MEDGIRVLDLGKFRKDVQSWLNANPNQGKIVDLPDGLFGVELLVGSEDADDVVYGLEEAMSEARYPDLLDISEASGEGYISVKEWGDICFTYGVVLKDGKILNHYLSPCGVGSKEAIEDLRFIFLEICKELGVSDTSGDIRKSFKIKDHSGVLKIGILCEDEEVASVFEDAWWKFLDYDYDEIKGDTSAYANAMGFTDNVVKTKDGVILEGWVAYNNGKSGW